MSSRQSYDLAVCNAVLSRGNEQNLQAVNGLLMAQIRTHFETQKLLGYANDIAIANHGQLSKINQTLHDLLAGQNELLDSQRESIQILSRIQEGQDGHLAQIKRERALKEVLYQIEKQLSAMNSTGDKLTRAHMAELALEVIDGNGFRTRDLSELDDKRTYDSLMDSLKGSVRNLTQNESDELVQFRTIYGAYEKRLDEGPEKPSNRIKELPRWNPIAKPVVPGWDLNRLKSEASIENKPQPPEFEQPIESFEDTPSMDRKSAEDLVIAEDRQKEGKEPLAPKIVTSKNARIEMIICTGGWYGVYLICWRIYQSFIKGAKTREHRHQKWEQDWLISMQKIEHEKYDKERAKIISKEENTKKMDQLLVSHRQKEEDARAKVMASYRQKLAEWEEKVKTLRNWESQTKLWEESEPIRKKEFDKELEKIEQENNATREEIEKNNRLHDKALEIMEASIKAFLDDHPSMQDFYRKPTRKGTIGLPHPKSK
jgi:hypothetical protein